MSTSISVRRISPQASKMLAVESKSVASCAKTVQIRIQTLPKSCRISPIVHDDSPHVVIHIIRDEGGAKAPALMYETECVGYP